MKMMCIPRSRPTSNNMVSLNDLCPNNLNRHKQPHDHFSLKLLFEAVQELERRISFGLPPPHLKSRDKNTS